MNGASPMNLTLFKDLGQIFAWSAAGAFFAYRFYTGWCHPNISITVSCVRQRAPIGTTLESTDFLTVLTTIKKGPNMTVHLLDLQARITCGEDAGESRRFLGIKRRCFNGTNDLPLVAVKPRVHSPLAALLLEQCIAGGYEPRIALEVSTVPEALFMAAAGFGFAFVPSYCERLEISGVAYKRLVGNPLKITTGPVHA